MLVKVFVVTEQAIKRRLGLPIFSCAYTKHGKNELIYEKLSSL